MRLILKNLVEPEKDVYSLDVQDKFLQAKCTLLARLGFKGFPDALNDYADFRDLNDYSWLK